MAEEAERRRLTRYRPEIGLALLVGFAVIAVAASALPALIGWHSERAREVPLPAAVTRPLIADSSIGPSLPFTYFAYLVSTEERREGLLWSLSPFPDAIEVFVAATADQEAEVLSLLSASKSHLGGNGYALEVVDAR
jgi:hypothetical protein